MSNKGRYILFAWFNSEPEGGFNDNCGLFETPSFAIDFFINSNHCKDFTRYQIVDIDTLCIISDGKR